MCNLNGHIHTFFVYLNLIGYTENVCFEYAGKTIFSHCIFWVSSVHLSRSRIVLLKIKEHSYCFIFLNSFHCFHCLKTSTKAGHLLSTFCQISGSTSDQYGTTSDQYGKLVTCCCTHCIHEIL